MMLHLFPKKVLFVACVCLYTATVPAQPLRRVSPEQVGMDSCRLAYADYAINQSIAAGEIPGAVLAVVHKGSLAYLRAYGHKQTYPVEMPMDVNTVFDLASVSKTVSTAISAMILIERGQLRLADKVKEYIPGFKGWEEEDGRVTDICVRDLLTHTSGLPPYANVEELQAKYGSPNPDGLIAHIAEVPRNFKPKASFSYSCLNYITLQRIIETVSGQRLDDFAKQHIFDVLGMKHTSYRPTDETLEYVAPTEKTKDGGVLAGVVHDPLARVMNGGVSGNAGVFSDANDLAILAAALLNGGAYNGRRILSPLGVKTMCAVPRDVAQFGRALGWDVRSAYASNNGDLLGANAYGHTGYTGTSITIDPENDVAVILLTNRVHPDDKGSVTRLRAVVANAVAASLNCPPTIVFPSYYYDRIAKFSQEPPITSADIVFLGNSLTEGGKWESRWPDKRIRNRGISGDMASGIHNRLHDILPGKPAKIFLMIGINDLSNNLTVDSIMTNIEQVVDRVRSESPGTTLYLQSVLPINESYGRFKKLTGKSDVIPELNRRIKQLAKARRVHFINLYPRFTVYKSTLRDSYTYDGLHLNEAGYEVWYKGLKRYL